MPNSQDFLQGSIEVTDADLNDGTINDYTGHVVSFQDVTVPVAFAYDGDNWQYAFATPGTPDIEYNWDKFNADILILTGNNDTFGTVEGDTVMQVYGGAGDDHISESMYNGGLYMDGGDGNDVLSGDSGQRETLIGGNGNDTLYITGPDKATGGAGSDTFIIGPSDANGTYYSSNDYSAFICDLQTSGSNHDVIQIAGHDVFDGLNYASFTDAEAGGTVDIRYQHGYTYLDIDTNGDHVPDAEIAHIKGIITSDLVDQIIQVPHEGGGFAGI